MSVEVVLFAEFTARDGRLTEVLDLVSGLATRVRAEPGNLEFAVYQRQRDPGRLFVFERYRDEAAFQTHLTAEYGAAFNAALADLIVEAGSQLTWLHPVEPA